MSFTPKQVGDILRARQAQALEGERPQQATVSGTGSGVSNRGTTGQVRATLNRSGTTIWVDAGGNLTELAADDIILVEKIGDDTRAEWHMVDFFESSGGSRVPTVRADIKEQISEIWASDGDPQALDTDADGNMRVLVELDLDGKELIIDEDGDSKIYESSDDLIYVAAGGDVVWGWKTAGLALGLSKTIELVGNADALVLDLDGDTTISAPTDDEIDIEVGGSDVAEWKAGGLYGAAAMDVYPKADGGGLFQRNVNHWRVPTDHFNSWAGWTWDAVLFGGTPTTVSVATYTSLLELRNAAGTAFFAYKSVSPTTSASLHIRAFPGTGAKVGIRIDDGTNNNYVELQILAGTAAGTLRLASVSMVGGVGPTTTYYADGIAPAFYLIRVTNVPGTGTYLYLGKDVPIPKYLGTPGALWTPTRAGLYFYSGGTGSDHAGLFDFWEQQVS